VGAHAPDIARIVRVSRTSAVVEFHDRHHYLVTHKNAKLRPEYAQFHEWLCEEVGAMMREWQGAESEANK